MDPSAANSALQDVMAMGDSGAIGLPGPSGYELGDQDPEEVIVKTYQLVQALSRKMDLMIQHNTGLATTLSRTIDGLNNINSKIQGSNSTLQLVQGQVDDIADTVEKVSTDVATRLPSGIAEENTGEEVVEDNTGEEVAEDNTGEEVVEEDAEAMEGGGRKKARTHKKRKANKRRTHKARK